jgi:hypothetical protein
MISKPESRRHFLSKLITATAAMAACDLRAIARQPLSELAAEPNNEPVAKQIEDTADSLEFKGKQIFYSLLKKAISKNWQDLPIGELIGKIARELEGTPYVASTIEVDPDREICSVNLTGLDCVTFMETTLAYARMLKKGGRKPEDLRAEVALVRYRAGRPGDYSTRLHYMSDWLADNSNRHIVKLLDQLPGALPFEQKVGYMSTHPASYLQLINQPDQVAKIKKCEAAINNRQLKYLPMNKIAAIEPLLKTGDIVAVCTSQTGLDVVHTGFVYRTPDGVAHFIDASSAKSKMKVTLEPGAISSSLRWSNNLTGAMFARPRETTC